MTIFTYGIEKSLLEVLQHYFGEAEYFDVTEQYQDILALCADVEPNLLNPTLSDEKIPSNNFL